MEGLVDKICSAIASAEGYFVEGSIPQKMNNPGDLRAFPVDPRATIEHGFWHALTIGQGISGLYHQVSLDIARGYTLRKLIYAWAPPLDHNDSENYLKETARRVGLTYYPPERAAEEPPLWTFLEITHLP
jgi:hypothetical protein